jgi:hemerythrin-like domain-containing protein
LAAQVTQHRSTDHTSPPHPPPLQERGLFPMLDERLPGLTTPLREEHKLDARGQPDIVALLAAANRGEEAFTRMTTTLQAWIGDQLTHLEHEDAVVAPAFAKQLNMTEQSAAVRALIDADPAM